MINFDQFKKFDRIKPLDQYEQQRQYWMFRNNMLNPLFNRSAVSAGGTSAKKRAQKIQTDLPSSFSFFTLGGEQFITIVGDVQVKTSTGYVKAFYPYDIPLGPFGTGDENLDISIEFINDTFWNGFLPFYIYSCDIDGNNTGEITYIKFDNLAILKSIDLTNCKDDIIEVDLAGCTDLESFTIPSSTSLTNLNLSNTQVKELSLNGCEYLEVLDITSTTFTPVYTLDLSGVTYLRNVFGDNCNLFSLITSASTQEEISLNDCVNLSSLICNNFSGNGGFGRIQIKNCSFGPAGLDILYNSLSSANGTNNTIYVYNNDGIINSDPTIATNKGYTVDINP